MSIRDRSFTVSSATTSVRRIFFRSKRILSMRLVVSISNALAAIVLFCASSLASEREMDLQEVVRDRNAPRSDIARSAHECDRARWQRCRAAAFNMFEDVLGLIPNLNWASGLRDLGTTNFVASVSSINFRARRIRRWRS